MVEMDAFALGALIIGILLIAMTMGSSYLSRLPLNSAMLYLGVGVAVGPLGLGLLQLDALKNRVMLERLTEIAVLISLFTAGMKLELPLRDRRWRIPVQLATVSMILTVAAVTALGVYGLGLSLGAAVLMVEQRARDALDISHRGYILDQGRVALEGPARQLLDDPRAVALYLGHGG